MIRRDYREGAKTRDRVDKIYGIVHVFSSSD